MGMMDDPEELPMISSSPELATQPDRPKVQDEIDMPALKRLQVMIDEQIASYNTQDRLNARDPHFTMEQQVEICQGVVEHLREFKTLVDTTITDIKEQYEV